MFEEVVDFLPPELSPEALGEAVLIGRAFDRAKGQLLLVAQRDGRRAVLSRPSDFEIFREIPSDPSAPFVVVRGDEGARLEVKVVDGTVLRLVLEPLEAERLERLCRKPTSAPPARPVSSRSEPAASRPVSSRSEPAAPRKSSRPPTRDSYHEPQSAEAEVVVVRSGLLRVGATPVPEAIRGSGVVEDLARHILAGYHPQPRAKEVHPTAQEAALPDEAEDPALPDAAPYELVAREPARHELPPSELPPALLPSPEAIARAAGRDHEGSSKRESVRPPAFSEDGPPVVSSGRDVAALRTLLRHQWERGALDEASQVARVLTFLGAADSVERRLATLQPEAAPTFTSPISPHLCKAYLAHDDEDPDLARLLVALWPALLTMRLRPERELGLRPRDAIDFSNPAPGFARHFQSVARALALTQPRLWIRSDVPGGLAYLNVSPLGSVCGGTLATGFSHEETLFVVGHHLSLYRPEVFLLALLPNPSDLLTLVCAGLYLEKRMPPDPKIVQLGEAIERFMVPQVRDSLRAACVNLTLFGDPRTAIAEWILRFRRAALFTAARTGLVLSGSLPVAAKMLRLMPVQAGISADELIDDLVGYMASPASSTLRRELGLSLQSTSETHLG